MLRLFQRGAKLSPKPTGGEHSTGYGLAVAKELAAKVGGELWCESVAGQGCRFFFRLPAHEESKSDPALRGEANVAASAH